MFETTFIKKELKEKIETAINQERMPHALFVKGPDGGGNLPIAVAIANEILNNAKPQGLFGDSVKDERALNLIHPDLNIVFPIQQNSAKKQTRSEVFMNEFREVYLENCYVTFDEWLKEIGHAEKKPLISVDEAQSIIRKLSLKPFEGSSQVMIIWHPELMNSACANKLLKIIEEPEPGNTIIMVGSNWDDLLPTIKSRVQLIRLKPFSSEEIASWLNSKMQVDFEKAGKVAEGAEGLISRAIELLEEEEFGSIDEFINQWLKACLQNNKIKLIDLSNEYHAFGRVDKERFLKQVSSRFRGAYIDGKISLKKIEKIQGYIDSAQYALKRNAHVKTLMLDLSLKSCKILNLQSQA